MKCFQLSCWWRLKLIWTNGLHFGRFGLRMRCIPASCGERFALRELHSMQEHTMFSHVVGPPRSRGMTWSRFRSFRSNTSPQYWQVFLSRSKMLCRVNFTSFFGIRSYMKSRMMHNRRMRKEMALMESSYGPLAETSRHSSKLKVQNEPSEFSVTTCAWPWKRRVSARRAVQTLTACQSRFRTKTCWLSADFMTQLAGY